MSRRGVDTRPAPRLVIGGRTGMIAYLGTRSDHWQRCVLLAGCLVLYFVWLMWVPLTNADEARYVEASREMIEAGNYVIPHFNYEPRYQKPVLIYWLQTGAMRVLGNHEFAARLPSAVAATLLVLLVHGFLLFWLPRTVGAHEQSRLRARGVAFGAGFGLMSAPLLAFWARAATTDATLTLLIGGCCIALLHADLLRATETEPGAAARAARNSYLVAAAFAGMGFLLKGPVGIAVPGIVWLIYHLLQRQLRLEASRVPWAPAVGIFIIIAAPWYVAVAVADPMYISHFFLHENVERFSGIDGGRELALRVGQLFFLSATSIVLFFPLSAYLLRELHHPFGGNAATGANHTLQRMRRFCWVWVAGVIGLFSLSYTQLPSYVANMVAGATILFAIHLLGRFDGRRAEQPDDTVSGFPALRPHLVETIIIVIGVACWIGAIVWMLSRGSAELPIDDASPLDPPFNGAPFPQPLTIVLSAITVAVGLLMLGAIAHHHLRSQPERAATWALCAWALIMVLFLQALTPIIIRSSETPTVEMAAYLRDLPPDYNILLWVEREADATVYYSQRRLELRTKADDDFAMTISKALQGPAPVILVADHEWAEQAPSLARIEIIRRFGSTIVARLHPQ